MKVKDKNECLGIVEEALDNVFQVLEEDRYQPSIPEAGTAPRESALESARDYMLSAVDFIIDKYGPIDFMDLYMPYKINEIISMIDGENMDDFEELKEIDDFIRDNGESKYHYINTVYRYRESDQYICVENQCTTDNDFIAFQCANITEKKEIVRYEWS